MRAENGTWVEAGEIIDPLLLKNSSGGLTSRSYYRRDQIIAASLGMNMVTSSRMDALDGTGSLIESCSNSWPIAGSGLGSGAMEDLGVLVVSSALQMLGKEPHFTRTHSTNAAKVSQRLSTGRQASKKSGL